MPPFNLTRVSLFAIVASTVILTGCHQPPEGRVATDTAKPAPTSPTTSSLDFRKLEHPLLTNHIQITSRDKFIKAGEAYFDHQKPPQWVIFQAVPVPPAGKDPDAAYSMYVAKLTRDGHGRISGIAEAVKVSPEGSANTCGWFSYTELGRILFGSTLTPPANNEKSGFQVGTRKYVWMFPSEMEVVSMRAPAILLDEPSTREMASQAMELHALDTELGNLMAGTTKDIEASGKRIQELIELLPKKADSFDRSWPETRNSLHPFAVFTRPNYDAECSYSKDGRFILYAHVRDEPTRGRPDADIWVYDTKTQQQHEIVHGDGYDGGPFFSPDGKMICYRSDRRGDDLLQLFVGVLKFDSDGVPIGLVSEHQVTDDEHVNWAPFWHPSGKFLVYGSSGVAHSNYEIFAVEVDTTKPAKQLRKRRVTFSEGADVLPVFSDDAKLMMWTAQRGPTIEGEPKPSSQLWIAEVNPVAGGFSDPAHLFDNLPDQRPEGPAPSTPSAHP